MGTLKTGAYCDGDNDDNNGTIYGKQYNWYAVMGINTVESATPTTEEILARKIPLQVGMFPVMRNGRH
jgi:hypothetical protein